MGDKVEDKGRIFTLTLSGLLFPKIPGTNFGTGASARATYHDVSIDQYNTISLSGGWLGTDQTGLIVPDGFGEGSYNRARGMFGTFGVGFSDILKLEKDGGGYKAKTLVTGSRYDVGLGRVEYSEPDRTTFDRFPGDSATRTVATLRRESFIGMEYWHDVEDGEGWFFMPSVGIITSINHVFGGDWEEYQTSPMGLALVLNLEIGWGSTGKEYAKEKGLTDLKLARIWYQELFDIIYNVTLYHNFSRALAQGDAALNNVWRGDDATGLGSLVLSRPLQNIATALDSGPRLRLVSAYLDADREGATGWKVLFMLAEVAKALGYLGAAAANDGDDGVGSGQGSGGLNTHPNTAGDTGYAKDIFLMTGGIAAVNNALTMAISNGVRRRNLWISPFALGAAEMLLSTGLGRESGFGRGILNAGTLTATGWVINPAQETGRDLVSSTISYWAPAGYNIGDQVGVVGQFGVRNYLKGSPLFLDFAMSSPAYAATNLGRLTTVNQVADGPNQQPYDGMGVGSSIAIGLGVGKTIKIDNRNYLQADISARLLNHEETGGVAINGFIGYGHTIADFGESGDNILGARRLDFITGVDTTAYITPQGRGVAPTFLAGLRLWR